MSGEEHGHRIGAISLHRLEGFSDAVFAFAVTLLVVSLEVPKSAHELVHTLRGTVAFGICFALLVSVWAEHSRFFKRYPMTDAITVALNMALLFMVLTYVYPMKFLFTLVVDQMLFQEQGNAVASLAEAKMIMVAFGLAIFGANAVMYLMHRHAFRHREQLKLTADTLRELRRSTLVNIMTCAIALISIAIAIFTGDAGRISGPIYMLIGLINYVAAKIAYRKQDAAGPKASTV